MSKGFVLQVYLAVYLILIAAEVTTSTYTCPPGTTTLITTGDVNEYSVEHAVGGGSFITVLSSSPDFGDFFVASTTPNTGSFKFKERFVLLGFSTTGQVVSGSYRYVSQLSVKTNSSFPENYNYTGEYNVESFEEVYFPFDKAVLTSEIDFTVMDVETGLASIYYWRLRLFGCREANASEIEPAIACPVIPSPSIVAVPPLPSCSEVAAPAIDPSSTNAQSNTVSDTSMSSSSSVERGQVTVTVTETVSREVPVAGRAVSGNTSTAGLVGAVVPLLIIIMILAIALIALLVLVYRKRSTLWIEKRGRSETLNRVPNIVYTQEDISKNPADKQKEEGMELNELYGSDEVTILPDRSSTYQHVGGAVNLVGIQEGNEYSSIDQIYYPTSNASSNQYEYMSSKGMEEGEGGDGSPTVTAHIDSTMNPAYSSIGE